MTQGISIQVSLTVTFEESLGSVEGSKLHRRGRVRCACLSLKNVAGKPLKLLFVGDSIAVTWEKRRRDGLRRRSGMDEVGVGAKAAAPLQVLRLVGACIAAACAQRLSNLQRRPVEWRTVAQNGADVRELQALLDQPEGRSPITKGGGVWCGALDGGAKVIDLGFDIAVVLCGVNDGKKFWQGRWPSHFREDLAELVRTLRTKGDPESVITVPNLLGHVEAPLFQLWPMCHLVDALFEQFEAQKVALADDGHVRPWSSSGRKVLTTDQNLWSVDGIHPSCEGYQTLSETNMVKTHVGSRRRKDAGTRQTAQETTRVVSVEMEEASQRLSANALRFGRCPERW
ncbi:Hypothetical protein SCF082_LOCUS40063 [Durusdinium trenchii]|uniref:SGNH hydrolase-type esterase domain-containing protein n=1 Tax=Durusdinium trenchii TaxID=1381693 RepID=A0ABP0Q8A2_9DINO